VNNITAKKGGDGSVVIQFDGRDSEIPNCLPIMKAWNNTVRLFRPPPKSSMAHGDSPRRSLGVEPGECPLGGVCHERTV
jgi:hypothetical protein